MTDKQSAAWYAVNTNPRCEDLVSSLLDRNSFKVFLPKIKNSRNKGIEPLFPGYLFVRLDTRLSNWVKIKYLHGVRKIVGFGHTPVPVPAAVIGAIERGLNNQDYAKKTLALKLGDKVSFARGPFAGLEGKFTGEVSGKERVRVLLDAITRPFSVEVEAAALSKVG